MIEAGTSSRAGPLVQVQHEPEDVGLVHVLDQREPAREIAVERGVADRELRLVARREHEPAVRVRERHQHRAADPRLEVLGCQPLEAAERGMERGDDLLDRDLAEVAAEVLRQPPRVGARSLGGVAGGHRDAVHVLRPERVDSERGDERRVDAAGEAQHDVAEAVLADVVVQREHEAAAHLLELRLERDDQPADLRPASRLPARARRPRARARPRARGRSERRRTSRRRRPIASLGSRSTIEHAPPRSPGRAPAPRPRRRARRSGRRRGARPDRRRGCRRRGRRSCPGRGSRASPRAPRPCRRGTETQRG